MRRVSSKPGWKGGGKAVLATGRSPIANYADHSFQSPNTKNAALERSLDTVTVTIKPGPSIAKEFSENNSRQVAYIRVL